MRDYLSIYLEQEEEEHVERAVDVVSKYDARERASCRLACEIRNYRDDSEQLGSSTGREWGALQRGRRWRKREEEVKKTELFRRANVCALAITRTRGGLSFPLSLSFPFASFSPSLFHFLSYPH